MLTEDGIAVDLDALSQVLRRADLLTIGFTAFPERLLVDTRSNAEEGPLVAIVPPVATVQERYLWLGKHRGSFGAPEAFSFFVWPHTVRFLRDADVLAPLRTRIEVVSADAPAALAQALARLVRCEHEAIVAAVRGAQPWQTLWSSKPGS